ncbi:hypothetical protein [Microcoleus sp. D3_18a_C4]|uniref:hypothetical protein n=1 Tax=unclassified Microcoleus TaxID=2642155 RepID=UPI002FD261B4
MRFHGDWGRKAPCTSGLSLTITIVCLIPQNSEESISLSPARCDRNFCQSWASIAFAKAMIVSTAPARSTIQRISGRSYITNKFCEL